MRLVVLAKTYNRFYQAGLFDTGFWGWVRTDSTDQIMFWREPLVVLAKAVSASRRIDQSTIFDLSADTRPNSRQGRDGGKILRA